MALFNEMQGVIAPAVDQAQEQGQGIGAFNFEQQAAQEKAKADAQAKLQQQQDQQFKLAGQNGTIGSSPYQPSQNLISQQQAEARAAEKAAAVAAAQQKRIALQAAVKAKADTRVQQMQQQQQQRAAANVARAQARPPKPPPPPAKVIANPFAQGRTPVITDYGQGYVDPQTLMDNSPPARYKKGGQVKVAQDTKKKYTSGGKINLNECSVSTAQKGKKNSNW